MMKYKKVSVFSKKRKEWLKLTFNKDEVSKEGQVFDTKWSKESNQPMSVKLSDALMLLAPHLMYANSLCDSSINLDAEMNYEKWFSEGHYRDDERFANLVVTGVEFIGNETLESARIFGHNDVEWTDKPYKCKLETPVINLNKMPENPYPLAKILCDQIDDLVTQIDLWLEKGETLSKAQQAMFDESTVK